MNSSNAVCAVRSDNGQIGHADVALCSFFDKAYSLNSPLVAWEALPDRNQQAAIYLVDDIEMTRHHRLKPVDWPLLQSFGEQRVIRIGESSLCDIPRLVPAQMLLINQNSHQFRNRQSWVRVIQLNRDLLWQPVPVGVPEAEASHDIRQRTRY